MTVKQKKFKQLMLSGHGRCFYILAGDPQHYKDIVMYGCLHDISFDMQCEGTRGIYMYNLVRRFDDEEEFLRAAAEKFLTPKVNDDWHIFNHLCDFINCFAADGNSYVENILEKKYAELYDLIMKTRRSVKLNSFISSFEYISIIIMQLKDLTRLEKIVTDIGAYFLRRHHTDDLELHWDFAWFLQCAKDKFGSDILHKIKCDTPEVRRFVRVMSAENDTAKPHQDKFTADEAAKSITEDGFSPRYRRQFALRANNDEKIKLAQSVISENDQSVKAKTLHLFSSRYNPFPLDPLYLIEYAKSENAELKRAALDALIYVKSDTVHDFALELLQDKNTTDGLYMLINNYKDSDYDILSKNLRALKFDIQDKSGWHGIILSLLDNEALPDCVFEFIYEKSMCSCCRESAFKEMQRRNILTEKMIEECLFDCNEEIREKANNTNNQ
ncbi:MAG: HEAT repeat domain-containing protein [Oscillospiraceae bacterium]